MLIAVVITLAIVAASFALLALLRRRIARATRRSPMPAADPSQPQVRRNPPRNLPPGATFTPTREVVQNDAGEWVDRRKVAVNRARRAERELGLSPRQLKKLRRAERRGE